MGRIALIGGHGRIALLATPLLVADGNRVTSIIRNSAHAADVTQRGATAVLADVESLDTDAMTRLFSGHDVVVWAAGAGGGNPARTYAVDRDAAIRAIDAAGAAGVDRFVMVSYFGAGADHGVPEGNPFHPYAESKAVADAHLRTSGLSWTILKPSKLTLDDPSGGIDATAREPGSVSRANVALVLRQVVAADRTQVAGREIAFNDGDVPIADALGLA